MVSTAGRTVVAPLYCKNRAGGGGRVHEFNFARRTKILCDKNGTKKFLKVGRLFDLRDRILGGVGFIMVG